MARAPHDPRGRTRLDDVDRLDRGLRGRGEAAVRLHDEQGGGHAAGVERFAQGPQIPLDDGQHVGVDHRGRGALVFLDLRQHVEARAAWESRRELPGDVRDEAFMDGVRIRVDEADRDGLDPFVEQPPHRPPRVVAGQRTHDLARGVHPLVHHHPQVALHQRRGLLPGEVVEPRHPQVAQLQHVAEALAGDQSHPRAGQLQDRVRRHRGAVHDLRDFARRHPVPGEHGFQPLHDGQRVVLDARRDLLRDDVPVLVEQHDVGERAPDVGADPVAAHASSRVTKGIVPPPRAALRRARSLTVAASSTARRSVSMTTP